MYTENSVRIYIGMKKRKKTFSIFQMCDSILYMYAFIYLYIRVGVRVR